MKYRLRNTGRVRGLLALFVSLAIVVSSHVFTFTSFSAPASLSTPDNQALQVDLGLLSGDAVLTESGVRIEWSSKFDLDNLGFNVYRLQDRKRKRINREIIPGSIFAASRNDPQNLLSRGSQSYAWFDPAGTADSIYYIESVSLEGLSRFHEALTPNSENKAKRKTHPINEGHTQTWEITSAEESENTASYQAIYSAVSPWNTKGYPAGPPAAVSQHMSASLLEDQWTIAGQLGLKIAIKKDGWYRVTQPQMAAAGFNPAVDIRNLQLFVDAQEVAINTSQSGGPLGSADYIEFFGRGLDLPTTDVRTYYLIAATSPGKRVRGELQIDSPPPPTPSPTAQPLPSPTPPTTSPGRKTKWSTWIWRDLVISRGHPAGLPVYPFLVIPVITWLGTTEIPRPVAPAAESKPEAEKLEKPAKPLATAPAPEARRDVDSNVAVVNLPGVALGGGPGVQVGRNKKTLRQNSRTRRKKNRLRQERTEPRREYSHAVGASAVAPTNFEYTVERKDRTVYFSGLLNGDAENFFGQVIAGTPVSQTINTSNRDSSAAGPARLEIKLQGASFATHQVSVKFNDVVVGSFTFFGQDGSLQVLNVPVSLLQNGANTVTFTPAAGSGTSIVDYVRITYPHQFRADSDSLKFSLLGTQTLKVDGFSNQDVRLIDYTDPLNVMLTKPVIEASGGGYAITVPASSPQSKRQRLFYAAAGTAEQAAAISLNQPSTLNTATNAADFLIVTTNSLSASLAPLVAARQAQGMTVSVVDVADIYDEFSYGVHGPQAVKDFLARAATVWATKPDYVVFAGDATFDPRDYTAVGNFDLVPTKLVDATFNETASDDWLTDFDDDGIADIPVGRLPLRTTAEADLVISKIVNYAPASVPQAALLVADNPGTPPVWDFEESNDNVADLLLPAGMTVQRINIRTEPSNAQATANIIARFNEGKAIVNYSGHGNVNVWTGNNVFNSAHATALTNGTDKLSFVVVMDCLNGYYHAPLLLSLSEAFLKAPGGGAVAAFASSGLTTTFGQRQMELELYTSLYGAQPIALGDAIKIAKAASSDIDVRRTWILFGDPSIKIR